MEWDEGHSGFLTNTLNVSTLAFETLHENKNKQQQNVNCSKVLNWRPLRFSLDTVLFGLTWHLPVRKSIIFLKISWRASVLFVGPLISLFWTGGICPGFKGHSEYLTYMCFIVVFLNVSLTMVWIGLHKALKVSDLQAVPTQKGFESKTKPD